MWAVCCALTNQIYAVHQLLNSLKTILSVQLPIIIVGSVNCLSKSLVSMLVLLRTATRTTPTTLMVADVGHHNYT